MSSTPTILTRPRRLKDLQRVAHAAILRPLTRGGDMQRQWIDGRSMRDVAAEFIKPNDRLTSFERLQLYNRQYWYRVIDCFSDDFPGLRAVLGNGKFDKLTVAYLSKYPSQTFTLRNLGRRLVHFLTEEPKWGGTRQAMALDMARFEWAQIEGFDNTALPPLTVDDLLGQNPTKLNLALQPHITLLELSWPLDDFIIALKRQAKSLRSEASNAIEANHTQERHQRLPLPRRKKTLLAVHRFDSALYYKNLDSAQYQLLCALRDGKSLARACALAIASTDVDASALAGQLQHWFAEWTKLGWFCKRT